MNLISKIKIAIRDPKTVVIKLKTILNTIRMNRIIIGRYKNNPTDFYFIQIGSNDGATGDPIHGHAVKYKWKGILVEPVKYLYNRLRRTYSNQENVSFENVAISNKEGFRDFYRIEENNEPNNPIWYDQLGSFNKDVVLEQRKEIPNFDKHFIKEKVKCITFSMLLKKHEVINVDLLHIDTEGYDYEIIKIIPFDEIKPKTILYEHIHLSDEDKKRSIRLLEKQHYKIFFAGNNTFAYLGELS